MMAITMIAGALAIVCRDAANRWTGQWRRLYSEDYYKRYYIYMIIMFFELLACR
jgi:hypothetical protein